MDGAVMTGADAEPLDQAQDLAVVDAGAIDQTTGLPDAGGLDTASDASTSDAAPADAGCLMTPPFDTDGGLPVLLSRTGLYSDLANDVPAPGVEAFHPRHALWSDGAAKRRWVSLPGCGTGDNRIDTRDMDHWNFPVGTRFWKEFAVGGQAVETRLIARTGPGAGQWLMGAYQWNTDHTDATLVPDGVVNANGTQHDIPSVTNCLECHGNLVEKILGFSAIQLNHAGGDLSLSALVTAGRLSKPPITPPAVPGNDQEQAALGWLHANCGHCHNPTGVQFPLRPFDLRLLVAETTVALTGAMRTAVNVPVENVKNNLTNPKILLRIDPGHSETSCVSYRDGERGTLEQMPPLATKIPDPTGATAVNAWIDGLR